MQRGRLYDAGHALADALSSVYGVPIGLAEPWVYELDAPLHVDREAFARQWPNAQRRPVVIPAGWFEALACFGPVRMELSLPAQLCWRTWAPTFERARRKAERKVLAYALQQYALGVWPDHTRAVKR